MVSYCLELYKINA